VKDGPRPKVVPCPVLAARTDCTRPPVAGAFDLPAQPSHTEETRSLERQDAITWLADGIRSFVEFQLGPLPRTRRQPGGVRESTLRPEFGRRLLKHWQRTAELKNQLTTILEGLEAWSSSSSAPYRTWYPSAAMGALYRAMLFDWLLDASDYSDPQLLHRHRVGA